MNTNYYKHCIVPQCINTTIKTPQKLFFYVPKDKQIRRKWLQLAKRDTNVSSISRMYFCEDHFDLPKDMENYVKYQIMGSVSQLRLKPGCLPSKFDCQPEKRKRTCSSLSRPNILKKLKMMLFEDYANESVESSTVVASTSVLLQEEGSQGLRTAVKSIQVLTPHKYRSKATQSSIKRMDQAASPLKYSQKSVTISPFQVKSSRPSAVSKKLIIEEHSDSDESLYTPSVTHTKSSESVHSLQIKSSGCSQLVDAKQKQKTDSVQNTINKIMNKPKFYIGVPKNCYFLIDIIIKEINIPLHHLLLCLKKIRLDNKKIFLENVPKIASVMRPFIVKLDSELNKKTLPKVFRHKYYNVSCIIDCLEIEIQKPSQAVNQALTWSEYKKANTIKYLISCTPNGLVNYISPGFGGRITDTCLVETCDFVQCLDKGMHVMADRRLKHTEQYLQKSGVQLVHPPNVKTEGKLKKIEAKQTKQTASLRVHVESVIRSLREFDMLKPHACINMSFVKILDDIITIACSLVNLQDSPIK
ncbi:hypothetical protein K1T71_014604 [Dendrolimus kikuchii]|uniref:Uncharacterized protein n=1 Tax=Dendrolimus kikuchii TaxID=765133 RepID=A0ACC1CEH5_9NEOP|nr:hypothetical protein K1T71_014604 [Dendrolimus kikuchii]